MKVSFPANNLWRQFNQGEIFGDIFGSFNLDLFSNKGKVRVAPQTGVVNSSDDDADLKYPVAIKKTLALNGTDYRWWILASAKLFVGNADGSPTSFVEDSTGSTPTVSHLVSDMEEFGTSLIVSLAADIAKLTAGTWTASWWQTTLSQSALGSNPHPIHVAFNNLLCIGDGNKLHTVDTSNNVDTGGSNGARLTLRPELQIVWIRSSRTTIWIGCRNTAKRSAEIIQWDGQSVNFNNNFKIGSSECLSGIIKDDVPYAINGWGQLLAFNGVGFVAIDNLPITFNKDYTWQDVWTVPQMVHRNGMALLNSNINILLNGAVSGNSKQILGTMPSGIWEYSPETGLYHKYSIAKTAASKTDFGSPVIIKPGALVATDQSNGQFLAGAELYIRDGNTTTTEIGVVLNQGADTAAKMGFLITPQIYSNEIEETWQHIFLLYKKMLNASTKIVVKYRTEKKIFGGPDTGVTSITWESTTSFSAVIAGNPDMANVAVGDEIQVISGVGAGICAHVTAITGTTTKTFTIDETVTGATGACAIRAENWVKLESISDTVRFFKQVLLAKNSSWIQFKLVMFGLGVSPELEKLRLRSESKTKF